MRFRAFFLRVFTWAIILELSHVLVSRADDAAEVQGTLSGPNSLIVVPVTLSCGTGMFVVDTGATTTAVDESFLPFFAARFDDEDVPGPIHSLTADVPIR